MSESHEVARGLRLSATVIAQDEEARIGDCLDSLGFCDEIVVVDGGSKDHTRDLALDHGARVLERPFDNFAAQHQFANENAKGRWILSLDADERVSADLAAEIQALLDSPGAAGLAAFSIPFENHFREALLRHGGLSPDRHLRLYRRELCRHDPLRGVHEKLLVRGGVGRLNSPIRHFGWTSFSQALRKSEQYADAAAKDLHARGERGSIARILGKPFWRFFRGYFLQLGFLDGIPGALVAGLRAHEAFARELRVWELARFSDSARDLLR